MTLNDILMDNKNSEIFKDCVGKTFHKFRLYKFMDLEDFYQDCSIFTMKKIGAFDNEKSSLTTFLFMILTTCAIKTLEKIDGYSKKISKIEIEKNALRLDKVSESSEGGVESIGAFIEDKRFNLEETVINKMYIDEILNLNRLTRTQKIILSYVAEGKSIQDIARILDRSEGNITTQISRARKRIVMIYK